MNQQTKLDEIISREIMQIQEQHFDVAFTMRKVATEYAAEVQQQLHDMGCKYAAATRNRCDVCGAKTIDDCSTCGAPQCCPQCCKISELQQQLAEAKKAELGIFKAGEEYAAKIAERDRKEGNWGLTARHILADAQQRTELPKEKVL